LYKQVDQDSNGIINEQEFADLVEAMNVVESNEEVEYLLHMIDPYNNQQLTFSEVVHLFSSVSVTD
jgi:Ca2+-binding EF-hand superfamily protein